MMACRRPTPPSSPLCGVRSTSGKILLTASSRPINDSALPERSNVVLSLSTTTCACAAGAAGAAVKDGAGAAGATDGAAWMDGGELRFAPQLLQNDSPAGFVAPQLG